MGIDCEFRAHKIVDEASVRALDHVHEVYPPGDSLLAHKKKWTITTTLRWVGVGYSSTERRPKVAHLIRELRRFCQGLEYGGDNAVAFVEVTDELIAEIERID